jgi:outer membrane protein assembly factor BamE (lipoprotein component of BamABCDE complex)
MKKLIIIAIVLLNLSSCLSRVEKKGYMFDLSDVHLLTEGVTSKEETLRYMGSPTLISYLDEEVWFYFAEERKHLLFFKPETVSRDILLVKFDNSTTIKELQRLSLNDENKKIDFSQKFTEVGEHETGFFKGIFGNIGQVKASQ